MANTQIDEIASKIIDHFMGGHGQKCVLSGQT